MNMKPKPRAFMLNDFVIPAPAGNRVICLIHTIPGDDGGRPIWDYLADTYTPLANGDRLFVSSPGQAIQASYGRTFVVDIPYGRSVAEQAARFGIPARYMTTPVAVLSSRGGFYELDRMGVLARIIPTERPVGFAIGDITEAWPEEGGQEQFYELPFPAMGLVNYIEARYQLPVVYVATGPTGPVIDVERSTNAT